MFKNITSESKSNILRFFPERQIYLRSGGEVSYHTFTTKMQLMIVAGLLLMATWCVITFANLAFGNNPLRTPHEKSKLAEAEFERLLEDAEAKYDLAQLQLSQQQETFEQAAKNFQEKHAILAQFMSAPISKDLDIALAAVNQSNGQVLMSPTFRDRTARAPRTEALQFASLKTGTSLDAPMADLDRDQNKFLLTAENSTIQRIERNRAIIESTKLGIETVLAASLTGSGGPLIDASGDADGQQDRPRLKQMQARAEEARRLDMAISAMPLGHPIEVDHYRTSSFGMRKDPFTKRPARHNAVDFASYRMAPIVATADGIVKSVTVSSGGYGRLVEIDHGYGFVTRYAHLAKSYVKRGQAVKAGDKVGGMGSTGRSTSTHLHYEVRFQGRAVNPDNFLKAGRYVQQN